MQGWLHKRQSHGHTDRHRDEYKNFGDRAKKDTWMDKKMEGHSHRYKDRHTDGHIDGHKDRHRNRRTELLTHRRSQGWTQKRTVRTTKIWTHKRRKDPGIHERINHWKDRATVLRTSIKMDRWMDKQTNEWTYKLKGHTNGLTEPQKH